MNPNLEPKPLRVLVVEDSEDDALLIVRELRRGGYDPVFERVETPESMAEALSMKTWDIIISDYVLPSFGGLAALDLVKKTMLDIPFIVVSGHIGEDIAVRAMKAGAHDYIMKGNLKRLVPAVEREIREAGVRRERKAVQDELSAATELLEKVFSITRVMVAYLDALFNFIRVNPVFAQALGMEPAYLRGKNYFDLFRDREDEAMFRNVLETGKPMFQHGRRFESERNGGKEPLCVNRSIHPVPGADGRVTGIILILLDVTKEVALEEQTRQSQKMEALGTLAGGIAHDFNNILAAIVVNTEMALANEKDRGGSDQSLSSVLDAANRGKELVKQVLAFSRKQVPELKPIKLSAVVREALKFLRASLPATIEIRENIAPNSGVVLSDAIEIQQVLLNLGSNAAYAMRDQGGELTVELAAVKIDEAEAAQHPDLKPRPYVRLTVADTGHGIPPEILPRIFDPFFTTKLQGEGTGMGLAVVHAIVKRCGGAIAVRSQPGLGTTFSLFFPRTSDEPKEREAPSVPIGRGTERILLVEDEEVQARSLHNILERLGYKVTFLTNSIVALDLFRSRPESFDVVITDQTMPHLVGSKLATAIMEIRPGTPVILCTGFSHEIDEATAKALGVREFMMKPFSVQEIASAIRRVLDNRRSG